MSRIGNIGISMVAWEEESREEFDMQIPVEKAKLPVEERKLGYNCQKKLSTDWCREHQCGDTLINRTENVGAD